MEQGFFTGTNVLIMGLGRFGGGVDSAVFAVAAGAKVIVTDLAAPDRLADSIEKLKDFPDIRFHLGGHDKNDFETADVVIVNPAVPLDNEFIEIARQCNKTITSQIEIFFDLCPATIIGITGSVGKSTTAALTAHVLKTAASQSGFSYGRVWLSGNIGNQPLLTVVERIKPNDLVVLELSSFQLEQLARSKKAPHVALLTNLLPNHLDRHGSFEAYCDAKENIFKYQTAGAERPAVSIFNADDPLARRWFDKYGKEKKRVCINFSVEQLSEDITEPFTLPGRANLSNLAAAVTVARQFGLDDDVIKNGLSEFKALPHRLELVTEANGVKWYNDSKATTPESTITALDAFDQPKILIAGGYDKNIPFDELGRRIADNAKAAILIGQTAGKIAQAISKSPQNKTKVRLADSLGQAVKLAAQLAEPGDVVLLSPACASYDMFENYQHRGSEFKRLVLKMQC